MRSDVGTLARQACGTGWTPRFRQRCDINGRGAIPVRILPRRLTCQQPQGVPRRVFPGRDRPGWTRSRLGGRYGVIAMEEGLSPTLIGLPAFLVAVSIRVTVPDSMSTRQTVFPSGVMAMAQGANPTLMAGSGLLVAVWIGVTPEPVVT